jgi:outer membrane protein OmpA-like peptidoglycan-associated protein
MYKKLILFVLFVVFSASSIEAQNFKEQFIKASYLMENENYYSALPILFGLEKDNPKNANIKSMIGYCYLHTSYEKYKAIPYFEFVMSDVKKNITPFYSTGNYKEKKAPIESIRFMGQAYHADYQFSLALDSYFEYQEFVDAHNEEDLNAIKRDVRITRNAMALKANPTEMTLHSMSNALNTSFPEYRPIVNADETVMIFTSRRDDGVNVQRGEDGKYFEDIYVSYRELENDDWSEPELIHANINSNSHEACLFLSADGQHMYIYKSDEKDGGIYESRLVGAEWSNPTPLSSSINSEYWETHANQSADGRLIAFVSDRPGGFGGRDIWFAKKLPNGEWGQAQNAGSSINTPYDEESPFLHPDGRSLYYSSEGHNTMGGFDVFQTKLDPGGEWETPVNIGYPVNTTGDDVFFVPTSDGKRAYFSSFREGGMGDQDIYIIGMVDVEEKALVIYKGQAVDTAGKVVKDIVITVYDESTGEVSGEYRPNKVTGKFLFIMKPGHTYEVTYDIQGMLASERIQLDDVSKFKELGRLIVDEGDRITIKKDSISDDAVANAQEEHDADVVHLINIDVTSQITESRLSSLQIQVNATLNEGKTLVLKNLEFYFDRTKVLEKSRPDIELVFSYLSSHPEKKIMIEGHTDSKGSENYNLYLSKARANKIKEILMVMGIAGDQLTTNGYGELRPLLPNKNEDGSDNPENRQHNRRVEFRLIK